MSYAASRFVSFSTVLDITKDAPRKKVIGGFGANILHIKGLTANKFQDLGPRSFLAKASTRFLHAQLRELSSQEGGNGKSGQA
jgi:hypothetical protein